MVQAADLIIRGGTVVDGTGAAPYAADIAIAGGKITEIGHITASAGEEIDARGKLVTPGFVDLHTHYDAQVTWSSNVTPSSWNGVTTVLIGNMPALQNSCKLMCNWGGVIQMLVPGQFTVMVP